jgi:dynein heavy chain
MKDKFAKFFRDNKIPASENINPLAILTTDAEMAEWQNEKLPSDEVSLQNGAILTNSDRYSLMIDPQLQGITWIKQRYGDKQLQVTRLTNKRMINILETSIETGKPCLIENLENTIDAVIQPVYARAIIRKGKSSYIKMGDKELSLDPAFKLIFQTKLSNPHYPPEIQAECTLINFTVTEKGLEDQLLTLIVKKERPDLAAEKERLIQQQNSFKITLRDLEADLLFRLVNQQGDILEDIELIENLERSKALSLDIKEKVEIAKQTSIAIDEASE